MVSSPHVKSKEWILVTSALPYVNNVPHLGNIAGAVLSADVFARYHRSQGNNTLFVCGTDEHGAATEIKALEEGLTPRQVCDKYHALHKQIYDWFNISFDIFGRTSEENHHVIVQEIFNDLQANGYIFSKETEQTYCEKDARFLADRFIEGECPHCHFGNARGDQCDQCGKLLNPQELIGAKCKLCGTAPVIKKSTHLFLDLPKLQPTLEQWIADNGSGWSQNAITTTKAWLQRGLEPRAITRDLSWGVPVPGMEKKVFYVWFDAPIGYVSITAQLTPDWREWWFNPNGVRLYQFMGKDNIPFHSIIFPASQLGTGKDWTTVSHIDATEYLQHEDGKFSKSRKTGLFGDEVITLGLPSDVFRYYLLINRPETSDTTFAWSDLQEKLNKELLANLGNLVNRTLMFIKNYQSGIVHEAVLDEFSHNFWQYIVEEETQVTDELERCSEKDALKRIMGISSRANQYFQEQEPWRTRIENPEQCRLSLYILANIIKDLAILLEPFLPQTSSAIFSQLGIQKQKWSGLGSLTMHGQIGNPQPLFVKLEEKQVIDLRNRHKSVAPAPLKPLQIKVGRIIDVHHHPNASKLFVETVDFGGELKTIVSGLVGHCREDDLRGKTALFVTNLAPANLRGVTSEGMILTAQGEAVEVLFADAPAGTIVLGEDAEQITIDEFSRHTLEVKSNTILIDGAELKISNVQVKTKIIVDGKVR